MTRNITLCLVLVLGLLGCQSNHSHKHPHDDHGHDHHGHDHHDDHGHDHNGHDHHGHDHDNHKTHKSVVIKKVESQHDVPTTLDRLEKLLRAKGLTIFTRVDHGAGAAKVKLKLPATQLLIFGNPKLGTKLMQENRDIGLDLPMKAMAWADDKGKVWLSYTAPESLEHRFELEKNEKVIKTMVMALGKLTAKAAGPDPLK